MITKQCRTCNFHLTEDQFNFKTKDRRDTECKVCNYIKKKKYTCAIPDNMKQCKVCDNLKEKHSFNFQSLECKECYAERKNKEFLSKPERELSNTKKCCTCLVIFDLKEGFYTKGIVNNKPFYSHDCKKCSNKRRINRRNKNKKIGLTERQIAAIEFKKLNPDEILKARAKRYKMSVEEINSMIEKQDNKCYICSKPASENNYGVLAIDHCHNSLKVRKLLCNYCNVTLGMLRDDFDYIEKLKDYLIEHKEP
jgi:hypothetical protein